MKHKNHWSKVFVLWCLSGATVAMAAPSSEETQRCVAASTQGQTDRDEGHLLAAREQLLSCAREVCPAIVRKSCADWLSDLNARMPSVVVRVQEARLHDVTDARVAVDGQPVKLDGRPLLLDPGTHVLAVETQDGPPIERTFLIAEGEHGRLLVIELPARPALEIAPTPRAAAPAMPSARVKTPIVKRLSVPTMAWVLGGLGVVGIATFTVLRVELASELRELERTCAPDCSDRQRDAGKQKALIADISLGVGIAALAGGVAWTLGSWLAQPGDAPSKPSVLGFSLVPTAGGAFATLAARY